MAATVEGTALSLEVVGSKHSGPLPGAPQRASVSWPEPLLASEQHFYGVQGPGLHFTGTLGQFRPLQNVIRSFCRCQGYIGHLELNISCWAVIVSPDSNLGGGDWDGGGKGRVQGTEALAIEEAYSDHTLRSL